MKTTKEKQKVDIKLLTVLFIFIIFFIFWCLKINGYFDFSSSYQIEWIQTYYQNSDALLMIDNNKNSTWGTRGDVHFYQEPITIKFVKERMFSGISIINTSTYDNSNIQIFASANGSDFYSCEYKANTNNNETTYTLSEPIQAQYLLLLKDDEETTWPISEIIIYD